MKYDQTQYELAVMYTFESIASDLGEIDLAGAVKCTLEADRMKMYSYDDDIVKEFYSFSFTKRIKIATIALRNYF